MNAPHDFSAVSCDIRDADADAAYDLCVAQLLASNERAERAATRRLIANPRDDLLTERFAKADVRRFAPAPVCITGWSPFDEDPAPTAAERAEQDYQDFRELQDREERHFGREA